MEVMGEMEVMEIEVMEMAITVQVIVAVPLKILDSRSTFKQLFMTLLPS